MPTACWMLMANSDLPDLLAYLALLYLSKVSLAIPRAVYASIIGIVCLSIWLSSHILVLWMKCGETEWFPTDSSVRWGCILFPYWFNLYTEHIIWKTGPVHWPEYSRELDQTQVQELAFKLSLPVEEYSISYWTKIRAQSQRLGLAKCWSPWSSWTSLSPAASWGWMNLQIGIVMQLDIKWWFNLCGREPGEDWKYSNRNKNKIAPCLSMWRQNLIAKGLKISPKKLLFLKGQWNIHLLLMVE